MTDMGMSRIGTKAAQAKAQLPKDLASAEDAVIKAQKAKPPKMSDQKAVRDALLPSATTLVKSLRKLFDKNKYGEMLHQITDWEDANEGNLETLEQLAEHRNDLLTVSMLVGSVHSIKVTASQL